MALSAKIIVETKELENLLKGMPKEAMLASSEAVEAGMKAMAEFQVESYTQNARPPKPEGSLYIRTFRLQDSSTRDIEKLTLREVIGLWRVGIAYASFVVGKPGDQADVHEGRWRDALESLRFGVTVMIKELKRNLNKRLRKFL
jgi:hypothetical protein